MEKVERRAASTERMIKDLVIESVDEVLRRAECRKAGDRDITAKLSLQNQQTPTSEPAAQSLAARPRPGKTKTKKGRTLGTDTRKRKTRPHLSASAKADLS